MTPNLTFFERVSQLPGGFARGRERRIAAMILAAPMVAFAAGAGVWAALESATPAPMQLTAVLPQGALLTIESKDFAGLLKRWNDSPEQAAWLKSDSYSVFSRSRLYGRLGDAQKEFAQAAGLPPDTRFLNEMAGDRSVFAWYDIGRLEFLYVTHMPAGAADKTRLVAMRGKFMARQVAGQTFYVRTSPDPNGPVEAGADASRPDTTQPDQGSGGESRTVAFAISGDWLLLASREDLMAGALTLLASAKPGGPAAEDSLAAEPWFADARAAAQHDPGDLRMTLNLDKIVATPYFRSYWVQRNVTEMKQYRSAVADLYTDAGAFREERVLLPKSPPENASAAPDLAALTAMTPPQSGVFRAVAAPSVDAAIASLNEKLLQRATGSFADARVAPDADVSVHPAGSVSDLETRIDAAPLALPAAGTEFAPLKAVLAGSGLSAMMSFSRTGQPVDGIWIPFQSAVVLASAQPWDQAALQAALSPALAAHLTAGALGLAWTPVRIKGGSYLELSNTRPLEMAVRGRVCILTDDSGLMQEMLGRLGSGKDRGHKAAGTSDTLSGASQATLIAGFELAPEREPFARWSALVDRTGSRTGAQSGDGAPTGADGAGSQPSFFSQNMRSLGDVFSALESERVVERRDGALTRQTVTYAWRH